MMAAYKRVPLLAILRQLKLVCALFLNIPFNIILIFTFIFIFMSEKLVVPFSCKPCIYISNTKIVSKRLHYSLTSVSYISLFVVTTCFGIRDYSSLDGSLTSGGGEGGEGSWGARM